MITQSERREAEGTRTTQTLPIQTSAAHSYYLSLLRSLPLSCNGALNPLRTLGITSCYRGEGVSTVAAQLSQAAVSTGMRVLLVDMNWKRPSIHHTFGVARSPGFAEAMTEGDQTEPPIQASSISNLFLLTAGDVGRESNLAYSLENMKMLIRSLQMDFDMIVFDLPEADATLPLSGLLEGIVLVIEAERVRWEVALRIKELLVRSGANVLGTVMNKRRQHIPGWLYRTL